MEALYDTKFRTQGRAKITRSREYLAAAACTNILETRLEELRQAKKALVQLTKQVVKDPEQTFL